MGVNLGRKLILPKSFKKYDFIGLSRIEPNARVRVRLIALHNIQDGMPRMDVARMLCVHYKSISNWINRVKTGGLSALADKTGKGLKPKLPEKEINAFRETVTKLQETRSGGRLRGLDIQLLLKNEFNVECSLNTVYDTLKRVGISWITSRSRHPEQNKEVQELFKKLHEHRQKCPACGFRY